MSQLFQCPQCGYRNYITAEDLDERRFEITQRMRDRIEGKTRKRWLDIALHKLGLR
jgi:hypothetical protein